MAGRTEVMAATRQSSVARWYRSDESTTAGRCLLVLRSVNGNGTRTTSPRLQSVVGPILRVVPESEGRLGKVQPGLLFGGQGEHGLQSEQHFPLSLRGKIPDGPENLLNRPA